MTLDALIMLAGALVALVPYMGFPRSWDDVILVVLGIFIVILGVVVRRRKRRPSSTQQAFVESAPSGHEGA
jgi:VIT1/CCC1 family predicted Fe2+/Mn2+ transporter